MEGADPAGSVVDHVQPQFALEESVAEKVGDGQPLYRGGLLHVDRRRGRVVARVAVVRRGDGGTVIDLRAAGRFRTDADDELETGSGAGSQAVDRGGDGARGADGGRVDGPAGGGGQG